MAMAGPSLCRGVVALAGLRTHPWLLPFRVGRRTGRRFGRLSANGWGRRDSAVLAVQAGPVEALPFFLAREAPGVTHTAAIVRFAADPPALSPSARAAAQRLLADTLLVGAAGAASHEAAALRATLPPGTQARLLGRPERVSAPDAAFANGFAIHCLEWDAVHEPAVVHALSVVTAALLAVSDRAGGTEPDRFLHALAVGVEVASGLGIAATGPMRFFRPSTAGVIGAALACARLTGMAAARFGDAVGLAYSFAGGTMQAHVEGSVALPLQIAAAARSAVAACDLAAAGFDGPRDALEGPFGYAALLEPLDLTRWTATLGTEWQIERVSIKPHPSGRASHGALGAAIDLRAEGVTLDRVAGATVHAPPLVVRLVGRAYAPTMSVAHARLCLAFLLPLALRDGRIDPRRFTPGQFADLALARLAERVRVEDDGNPDGNALGPQRLVLTLADGRTVERAITANPGSPDAPLSPEQAAARAALAREVAGPQPDERIHCDPLAYATEPR